MEGFKRELGAMGSTPRRDLISALTMFAEDLKDSAADVQALVQAMEQQLAQVRSAMGAQSAKRRLGWPACRRPFGPFAP